MAHSLAVAFGAKIIATKGNADLANDAFTAGIIHNAGKLILDEAIFEKRDQFDAFLSHRDQTFLGAEKKILGFDHAEIAADICRKWHIPNALANILHFADSIAMMSDLGPVRMMYCIAWRTPPRNSWAFRMMRSATSWRKSSNLLRMWKRKWIEQVKS